MKRKKLQLKSEALRLLGVSELQAVVAGLETGERESIIYWCPGNTSIQRSCSSCA